MQTIRVTVWGENLHEQTDAVVRELYPDGMHGAIARQIADRLPDAHVRTATLEQPEHGLTAEVLDATDVFAGGTFGRGGRKDSPVPAPAVSPTPSASPQNG